MPTVDPLQQRVALNSRLRTRPWIQLIFWLEEMRRYCLRVLLAEQNQRRLLDCFRQCLSGLVRKWCWQFRSGELPPLSLQNRYLGQYPCSPSRYPRPPSAGPPPNCRPNPAPTVARHAAMIGALRLHIHGSEPTLGWYHCSRQCWADRSPSQHRRDEDKTIPCGAPQYFARDIDGGLLVVAHWATWTVQVLHGGRLRPLEQRCTFQRRIDRQWIHRR